MNVEEARIQRLAPIYRSFPISWVRRITQGKSLTLVGSVNDGLVKSLGAVSVSAAMSCIDSDTGVQRDRLDRFVRESDRADWTIITDPDAAALVMGDADLLFAVRQKTRETLLFPMPFPGEETQIATGGFDGMSPAETAGGLHWRWITSIDGNASFLVWSAFPPDDAFLTFTSWFSRSFREQGISEAHLSLNDAAGSRQLQITDNQTVSTEIRLNAGATLIQIGSDVTPVAADTDSRTLSLALCQPSLVGNIGTLIPPADFVAGSGGPRLMHARKLLHRFGFAVVAGRACGIGHLTTHREVPPSFGTALRSLWESADPLPHTADITPTASEVIWLTAGMTKHD